MPACLFVALTLLSLRSPCQYKNVPFEVLRSEESGMQVEKPMLLVLRSEAQWHAHFAKYSTVFTDDGKTGRKQYIPKSGVDFRTHEVVAIHFGRRSHGGDWAPKVKAIVQRGPDVRFIDFGRAASPQKVQRPRYVTTAITYPGLFLKVPRSHATYTRS